MSDNVCKLDFVNKLNGVVSFLKILISILTIYLYFLVNFFFNTFPFQKVQISFPTLFDNPPHLIQFFVFPHNSI